IYAPIGLPIKAETPEEIAISILAEIIAAEKGADIKALRSPLTAALEMQGSIPRA
ncbi:MAG TPA: XdhC family protein, partial [Thermosynergistes sp.]|nr:XdhC family protein [Thermosynergistes sp.]